MSTPSQSLTAGVLSTSFRAMPAKHPDVKGISAGTGRTIITPLEAKKLQSAESLKPLHERDIGPGSYVALTQRAAARNVKAGLVDAFVRSRSVAKSLMDTGSGTETGDGRKDEVGSGTETGDGRKDEVGSGTGTETGDKTKIAMTDETTKPVDSRIIGNDAKGTMVTPPIKSFPLAKSTSAPTSDSALENPIAKKPFDPTPVAPTADNTNTNTNASPTSSKKPLHQPSPSHQDSPPSKNTSTRVSSAGSAGVGGKRAGSNPLQKSDGNKRVGSSGAGNGSGSLTSSGGSGKSGGQDGEVTGKGKVDGKEKRKSDGKADGAGKGNWKK